MPIVRLNTTTNTNSLKTNVKQAHVRIESLGSALCGAHVRVIVCIEMKHHVISEICKLQTAVAASRVVFVGGRGSRGTSLSLDLTFPPTGLSENLGGMERGGEGKGKGKGGRDHLPYSPHWLLPQIPPWQLVTVGSCRIKMIANRKYMYSVTDTWMGQLFVFGSNKQIFGRTRV